MPLSVEIPAPGQDDARLSCPDQARKFRDAHREDRSAAPRETSRVQFGPLHTSHIDGFRFHTDVVVRFAETDAQGVAHNSNYLVWFEVARVAYLAEFAGGYNSLRETGLESFVLESHIRYLRPAHFDEHLRIHARIGELRGARFRFDYVVARDGETIADGWTTHACVDAETLRPTRIPSRLAEAIARAEALA